MTRKALRILALALLLALAFGCGAPTQSGLPPPETGPADFFFIRFLDVGQADSALIGCDGQYMLVDGGNVEDSSLVASVLQRAGIDYLDYMVCTHAHEDHVGGLPGALAVCKVGTALAPVTQHNTLAFKNFVKYLRIQGKEITVPACDSAFSLGSATVKVLAPRRDDYESTNNTSIVLMVQHGVNRFLLTGDAERESELDMVEDGVDLSCDLMKVGHHGSNTSSSYLFLNAVMPTYGVISVGRDNVFAHPKASTLSRLRDAQIPLLRTDMQGDILVESDGQTYTVTPSYNPAAVTNPTSFQGLGQLVSGYLYIGNRKSLKFHVLTCRNLPQEENRAYFEARSEAVAGGYSPCGQCRP